MNPTLSDLERFARGAGAILRESYNKEHQVSYKGVIDLVTEADHASESFLIKEIQAHYPDSHIIAEESGETKGDTEGIWYIDPLDGTVNYAHHVPAFCVSIAYARNGSVILGAVYDPLRDELFSAERGKGAYLNGKPIHASNTTELQKSLLVTGFPYDTWNTKLDNFKNFEKLAKMTQGVRRLGSAALDACYVAAGRFDVGIRVDIVRAGRETDDRPGRGATQRGSQVGQRAGYVRAWGSNEDFRGDDRVDRHRDGRRCRIHGCRIAGGYKGVGDRHRVGDRRIGRSGELNVGNALRPSVRRPDTGEGREQDRCDQESGGRHLPAPYEELQHFHSENPSTWLARGIA